MKTSQHCSTHTLEALVHKLRPSRFPGMTPVMRALVGFVIGAQFAEPPIAEITVTSEGFVLARAEGETTAKHFIGNYSDVLRNWFRLIASAGLSQREYFGAIALFAHRVGFYGRDSA